MGMSPAARRRRWEASVAEVHRRCARPRFGRVASKAVNAPTG